MFACKPVNYFLKISNCTTPPEHSSFSDAFHAVHTRSKRIYLLKYPLQVSAAGFYLHLLPSQTFQVLFEQIPLPGGFSDPRLLLLSERGIYPDLGFHNSALQPSSRRSHLWSFLSHSCPTSELPFSPPSVPGPPRDCTDASPTTAQQQNPVRPGKRVLEIHLLGRAALPELGQLSSSHLNEFSCTETPPIPNPPCACAFHPRSPAQTQAALPPQRRFPGQFLPGSTEQPEIGSK